MQPDRSLPLLVLVNLGTPAAPTPAALRRYLAEFLSDRRVVSLSPWIWQPLLRGVVLPLRAPRSARAYRAIWQEDGSPLMHHSQALARAVAERLQGRMRVRLAMRYGEPSLATVLEEENPRHVMLLPLYPQYSSTTTASVMDAWGAWITGRHALPSVCILRDYYNHPAYITALANSVREAWQQQPPGERLLFSFHGIPERLDRAGDPYRQQCETTAQRVAEALDLKPDDWQLVFQSRFGRERWLSPYADQTLASLPARGVKSVDVICPGFAVDCLETLEEMAVENRQVFLQAGGERYRYIPCLNARDDHVQLMDILSRQYHGGSDPR